MTEAIDRYTAESMIAEENAACNRGIRDQHMGKDVPILCTIVRSRWHVSTIERDSSDCWGGRFHETLVWRCNEGGQRGDIVGQGSGPFWHFAAVKHLLQNGEVGLSELDANGANS